MRKREIINVIFCQWIKLTYGSIRTLTVISAPLTIIMEIKEEVSNKSCEMQCWGYSTCSCNSLSFWFWLKFWLKFTSIVFKKDNYAWVFVGKYRVVNWILCYQEFRKNNFPIILWKIHNNDQYIREHLWFLQLKTMQREKFNEQLPLFVKLKNATLGVSRSPV